VLIVSRKRIAFVTWSGEPNLAADDELAADACGGQGMDVEARPWDRPCDWSQYDAIVLRTTWNYHLVPALFTEWIERLEAANAPLWNPPAVLRWNMHKSYLLDLRAAGAAVPETIVVPKGARAVLSDILGGHGWAAAVVKPAISANAFQTTRATEADAARAQAAFEQAVAERDMLVQEFVPEIASGELSLMFIRGRFSHAVRKVPVAGEFRVQEACGGVVRPEQPDGSTIERCKELLSHLPCPTLYARVDGVPTRQGFLVFEVEAIEPSLFLAHDPGAAARLAAAL
jgi:glutathione synthase/RimK-type ligase-like ATP-grasp enzyme